MNVIHLSFTIITRMNTIFWQYHIYSAYLHADVDKLHDH